MTCDFVEESIGFLGTGMLPIKGCARHGKIPCTRPRHEAWCSKLANNDFRVEARTQRPLAISQGSRYDERAAG